MRFFNSVTQPTMGAMTLSHTEQMDFNPTERVFNTYLIGGFECSTHRNGPGKRVDIIAATQHDQFARQDYERLSQTGIGTARDGARWHLIETSPYTYDFSSVLPQIRAAQSNGVQVIWDMFHYGYPDDLDLLSPEFVDRFAAFGESFVRLLLQESVARPALCLMNEVSFFAWAAGEAEIFYPYLNGRGDDIKRQLIRAYIACAKKIRRVCPEVLLTYTDPVVNVLPSSLEPENILESQNFHAAQYFALNILLGLEEPELGGSYRYVDILGVNYYDRNQWRHPTGEKLSIGDPQYKPFNQLLTEMYERYGLPIFIAECGIEGDGRAAWLRTILNETKLAADSGVPIYGVCLYPILDYPGWDDDRYCDCGLWSYADQFGVRKLHKPLYEAIQTLQVSYSNI